MLRPPCTTATLKLIPFTSTVASLTPTHSSKCSKNVQLRSIKKQEQQFLACHHCQPMLSGFV
eukprot:m.133501 g.133501  ORF g.133501 m.133501 type:complete len:62 (-) comp13944_c5_seq1:2331-2516(-)